MHNCSGKIQWWLWLLRKKQSKFQIPGRDSLYWEEATVTVQFSPLTDRVVGGTWGTIQQWSPSSHFCGRPSCSILAWARDVHALTLSAQHFPLPTSASPTLQGAQKDGFGEAVVTCEIHEPCEFPFFDSCQNGFLWAHKEFDLAPLHIYKLFFLLIYLHTTWALHIKTRWEIHSDTTGKTIFLHTQKHSVSVPKL